MEPKEDCYTPTEGLTAYNLLPFVLVYASCLEEKTSSIKIGANVVAQSSTRWQITMKGCFLGCRIGGLKAGMPIWPETTDFPAVCRLDTRCEVYVTIGWYCGCPWRLQGTRGFSTRKMKMRTLEASVKRSSLYNIEFGCKHGVKIVETVRKTWSP
jgi:hypothetical protein